MVKKKTDDEIFDWCENAETMQAGGFVISLIDCWRRADKENKEILRQAMSVIMDKYPYYK